MDGAWGCPGWGIRAGLPDWVKGGVSCRVLKAEKEWPPSPGASGPPPPSALCSSAVECMEDKKVCWPADEFWLRSVSMLGLSMNIVKLSAVLNRAPMDGRSMRWVLIIRAAGMGTWRE